MKIDLSGRVALVTGGSRGIGFEVARSLLGAGAKVAVIARDRGRLDRAVEELGSEVLAIPTDVAHAESAAQAVRQVEDDLGSLDILVNNAGLTRDGVLVRMSEEDWDAVMDVNLKGAFHMTKSASRGMMKRRWGRVVNVTSVVGLTGNRGQSNYAASKAGLVGFTKSIAKELASRNVLVNAIAPGFIETDMTAGLADEVKETLREQIPLGRLGSGTDVAHAVLFLASDLADYITGQTLAVDGGMVM